MRATVQKVSRASVKVNQEIISSINEGYLVFVGISKADCLKDIEYIAKKIANLRVFEDEDGKMNLSIKQKEGEILLVSQFTLYADVRKGNRPSFTNSMPPDKAYEFYLLLKDKLEEHGLSVKLGKFQSKMEVSLVNDGPCTIQMDSERIY